MSSRTAVAGFCGPSNVAISRTLSPERSINLYLQDASPGTGRSADMLVARPGLRVWANYPDATSVRGLFEQNGRAFGVFSDQFAEVFDGGMFGPGFAVADDTRPVSMCSNGSAGDQMFLTSGNLGYIYDLGTDALTTITDPNFLTPTRRGEFMDGYFLNFQGNGSRAFQWSALEDGLTWSGLDIAERSIASDSINGIIRSHRELWILGQQTSEVWYDSGNASTPFQPIQGVFVEHGTQAVHAIQRTDNTILWLGWDVDGNGVVWRADGYTPRRISTSAVELSLQTADTPTDAVAFVCQINGHDYYVLILPRQDTSWVYDVSRDRWVEWAHWDPTHLVWRPFRPWNHIFAFNTHLVGDRLTGTIYELSTSLYDDELTDV